MSAARSVSPSRFPWAPVVTGVVLAAAAALSSVTPWPLIVVVVVLVASVLASRLSWLSAIGGAILAMLAGAAVVSRLTPFTGLGLDVSSVIVLLVIGVAMGAFRLRPDARPWPRPGLLLWLVPVVAIPVAHIGALVALAAGGRLGYAWVMNNDAVWNMVASRFVIADGGLDASVHPNPAPLSAILAGLVAAHGRGSIAPGGLLAHDVATTAQLWVALAVATAVLAAGLALRATRSGPAWLRVVASVIAGLVPLSGFVWGFALHFGFLNATEVVLVLLASWAVLVEPARRPLLRVALFSAATLAMLSVWAPMAIIPGVWCLAGVVSLWRQASRRAAIVQTVLALLPIPVYFALVTLTDLRREGGTALSADGASVPLTISQFLVSVVVAAGLILLFSTRRENAREFWGIVLALAGAALAMAYLFFQRLGAGGLWGYYPVKFAWILICFLLVGMLCSVFEVAARSSGMPARRTVAVALGPALVLALMSQLSSPYAPSWRHQVPLVDIVAGTGIAGLGPAAQQLFAVDQPGRAEMAVSYVDPVTDRFMNAWLLQLEVQSGADPIRAFSYYLDPGDESQVCDAARAWNRPVTIYTSDAGLEDRLEVLCSGARFTVVIA